MDHNYQEEIEFALGDVSLAEDALDETVKEARDAGLSWTSIGDALGTTRQGAWKRFRHLL